MSREILFKAKRTDNGEWVEGLPCRNIYKNLCIQPISDIPCCVIDESTLCQYTGLTDKNGNKIWENDIVKDKDGYIYKCVWDSGNCEYMLVNESESYGIGYRCGFDYEVLGTIFDNPELLGGEHNGRID